MIKQFKKIRKVSLNRLFIRDKNLILVFHQIVNPAPGHTKLASQPAVKFEQPLGVVPEIVAASQFWQLGDVFCVDR